MTIRRQPSDFVVEELLEQEFLDRIVTSPSPQTPLALYQLTKSSLTTPEAIQQLAKAAAISASTISFAGLKDKHALTTQHLTLAPRDANHAHQLPEALSGNAWQARRLGWAPLPIAASHIHRNRFTLIVRDLSIQAARQMSSNASRLAFAPDSAHLQLWFVNYFGDQRFGSARHGRGFVARSLIAGDFETALKLAIATPARKDSGNTRQFSRAAATHWGNWSTMLNALPRCPERRAIEHLVRQPGDFRGAFTQLPQFQQQICVEAFQSLLWNQTARDIIETLAERHAASVSGQLPTPDRPRIKPVTPASLVIRTPDEHGDLVFPTPPLIDDDWRELELPLLGPSSALHAPWKEAAQRVLATHNISISDLRIPGLSRPFFGEAPRRLFTQAEDLSISPPQPDELSSPKRTKVTVRFALTRGSYATVLLRALGQ